MDNQIERLREERFIDLLIDYDVLQFSPRGYILRNGRSSPYMINMGKFTDGISQECLGVMYANKIIEQRIIPDLLFGPSYKGIPLAITTALGLLKESYNVRYAFDRKEVKAHGEGTHDEIQSRCIIGSRINDGDRILLLDDVITTGGAKYDALTLLGACASNLQYLGLIIAVDREEVGDGPLSSAEEFTQKTKIPVHSVTTVSKIVKDQKDKGRINKGNLDKMIDHLRQYGTPSVISRLENILK